MKKAPEFSEAFERCGRDSNSRLRRECPRAIIYLLLRNSGSQVRVLLDLREVE